MKTYNILAVITARGGSKRLPGKNIKKLGGKPLICYSIESAKQSKLLTHTIVSTDDEKIADIARKCGGDVPFMRPKELAEDKIPHLPVMQHGLSCIRLRRARFEHWLNLGCPDTVFCALPDPVIPLCFQLHRQVWTAPH